MSIATTIEALHDAALRDEIASLPNLLKHLPPQLRETAKGQEIIGIVKFRTGDIAAATSVLAELAAKNSCDTRALVLLMRGLFTLDRHEEALAAARGVLEREPANIEALKLAGRVYNQRRDWGHADRFWRQLTDVAPTDSEGALQVARIAGRRNEWEAVDLYARLHLSHFPDHPEALRMVVESNIKLSRLDDLPRLLPAFYRAEPDRARIALRTICRPANAMLAATVLRDVLAIDPSDKELAGIAGNLESQLSAMAFQKEIDHDDMAAARLFAAIRMISPQSPDAADGLQRLRRGAVNALRETQKKGDSADILEKAARVLEIDPQMVEALFARGRVRLAAGETPDAIVQFEHCVKVAPDEAWYELNLGRALEKAEIFDRALKSYTRVVQLITDESNVHRTEAARSIANVCSRLVRKGRDAYRAGDMDQAWAHYQGVAQAPNPPADLDAMLDAIKRRAFLDLKAKFSSEDATAVDAAESYLAKDPDNLQALLMLARRLMAVRQYERALPAWDQLSGAEPDNSHYHLQRARCCSWLRLKDKGLEAARRALQLDPTLAEATKLQENLERL